MVAEITHLVPKSRRRTCRTRVPRDRGAFALHISHMNVHRILHLQFLSLLLLAIVFFTGLEFDLFFSVWWLDILMHFLGGVWAGYAVIWVSRRIGLRLSFMHIVILVLAIGVAWELFEYMNDLTYSSFMSYPKDTVKDIVVDVVGGIAAYRSISKRV